MPKRPEPVYRFEVAWDGSFSHPAADLTPVYLSHDFEFGSDPAIDGRAVKISAAGGWVILNNIDQRFDPDSTRLRVTLEQLRRRNPCRLFIDGVQRWEGLASFSIKRGTDATSTITLALVGKYTRELVISNDEYDFGGGTCADLSADFAAVSGVPFVADTDAPVGIVSYKGNWITFLENFGRYAGGWCLEMADGSWKFQEFASAGDLPIAATLSLDYGPIEDSIRYGERVGYVRNYAECVATYWERREDNSVVASATRSMARNQRATMQVAQPSRSRYRSVAPYTFSVSPPDIAVVEANRTITAPDGSVSWEVDVRSLGYPAVPPQPVTVSVSANTEVRAASTPVRLDITEFDTQNVYKPQQLLTPAWFPVDFRELGVHFKQWLRYLSTPLELVGVRYTEAQTSLARSRTLRDEVLPGNVVRVQTSQRGRLVSRDVLILSVRLFGSTDMSNHRELIGVVRKDVPPAPLTVTTRLVTDRTAVIGASVPSPALENLYMRRRTA